MIWLWPTIWCGVIVTGIIGFLQVLCGVGALACAVREAINDIWDRDWNIKWRKRWLVDHFGESGAKYWLLNKKASDCYLRALPYISCLNHTNWFNDPVTRDSIRAHRQLCKITSEHPWLEGQVRRAADGVTLGTVVKKWGGQMGTDSWDPPWGADYKPYPAKHFPEREHKVFQSYGGEFNWHHGEPRWLDFMAARDYDSGRKLLVLDVVDVIRIGGSLCSMDGWNSLCQTEQDAIEHEAEAIIKADKLIKDKAEYKRLVARDKLNRECREEINRRGM